MRELHIDLARDLARQNLDDDVQLDVGPLFARSDDRAIDVLQMLSTCGASPIGRRDAALLAIGYIFALRRSELVALDLDRQGDGDAGRSRGPCKNADRWKSARSG